MKRESDEGIFEKYVRLLSEPESGKEEVREEEQARLTSKEISDERERLKNKVIESILKDKEQDRGERKDYASMIFGFMCLYMFLALLIVFCCGFGWMVLSDMVLVTLLTTTLADVISIFGFVAKYLYYNR